MSVSLRVAGWRERRPGRGVALLTAVVGLALLTGLGWWGWELLRPPNWLPAFTAPMHAPTAGDPPHDDAALRFDNLTLRQFIPLALPAKRLRLRFSNQFGEQPLQIGEARIAWRAASTGAAIRPGSDLPLSFGGQAMATIPAGQTLLSDPVALPPGPSADLGVSLYLPNPTPRASWHFVGSRSSYRAPGSHAADLEWPTAAATSAATAAAATTSGRSLYFLAAVEAEAPRGAALWVAFGDSITDGAWHTVDTDRSWPALWGLAWAARPLREPTGVLNAGVGGNRLLTPLNGPSGLDRFDRDVLSLPGVHGALLLIGINDLGGGPVQRSAEQVIAGQTELIRRARARGLKVVGATLTPVGGSFYDRPEVEAARQAVNQWIRTGAAFDAVVDFDAVVRDPADPMRFRPGWDIDKLHPSDAGYRAMAEAVVRQLDQAGLAPPLR